MNTESLNKILGYGRFLRKDADFEEQHPREEAGKFAPKGEGGAPKYKPGGDEPTADQSSHVHAKFGLDALSHSSKTKDSMDRTRAMHDARDGFFNAAQQSLKEGKLESARDFLTASQKAREHAEHLLRGGKLDPKIVDEVRALAKQAQKKLGAPGKPQPVAETGVSGELGKLKLYEKMPIPPLRWGDSLRHGWSATFMGVRSGNRTYRILDEHDRFVWNLSHKKLMDSL